MKFMESERLELKREYTEDIRREVIAFANTMGGDIYIGIENDGTIVGVADADKTILSLVNSCQEGIKPDISLFLKCNAEEHEGMTVVHVEVQRGTSRPYHLSAKGMKPAGVYVRLGTASVPSTEEGIRALIKESDGDSFEEMRSLEQNLTFSYASHFFQERNFSLEKVNMMSLGLMDKDGLYTNLGLLLSDQCPHVIKAAVFRTEDQSEFQDRKEFSGSLFAQLQDTYQYMMLSNRTEATFKGLYRKDSHDYPEEALREALLNAIVHKDYSRSIPTIVSIYENRMEIISNGSLPYGYSMEDILTGLSICRNSRLAQIFYRLNLIEAYGTGLARMISSYSTTELKPEFLPTPHVFKVTLPKTTAAKNATVSKKPFSYSDMDTSEERAYLYLKENGASSRQDLEKTIGGSSATAVRTLRRMKEKGLVKTEGNGKNTKYRLWD